MLNVNAYLPSCERYDSIVDTVSSDVSDLGDIANQAGIPEQMIVMADDVEQSDEQDDVQENNLQEQEDTSKEDEPEAKDDSVGDTTNSDETPEQTEDEESEDESDDDEDDTTSINYAIESYTTQLKNAGELLSKQSVGFLTVGLNHLSRKLAIPTVSVETIDTDASAAFRMVSANDFLQKIEQINNHRNHVE